jgi:hypothetical protein
MGEISESAVYEEALTLKPKSITPFTDSTLQECREVYRFVARPSQVVLDGQSLNLSSVVAVARCVFIDGHDMFSSRTNIYSKDTVVMCLLPKTQRYTKSCRKVWMF